MQCNAVQPALASSCQLLPPLWPNRVPSLSRSGPDRHPTAWQRIGHRFKNACNVLKHSPERPLNLGRHEAVQKRPRFGWQSLRPLASAESCRWNKCKASRGCPCGKLKTENSLLAPCSFCAQSIPSVVESSCTGKFASISWPTATVNACMSSFILSEFDATFQGFMIDIGKSVQVYFGPPGDT